MRYLLILFLAFVFSSSIAQVNGPSQIKGVQSYFHVTDTSGANVPSGAYPVAVYDLSNNYIGTAYNPTDLVSMWNSIAINKRSGILSLAKTTGNVIDSFNFVFSTTAQRMSGNKKFNVQNVHGAAALFAWYDISNNASLIITDTPQMRITQINDLSGNGRNLTQSATGLKPWYVPSNTYGNNQFPFMSMNGHLISVTGLTYHPSFTIYAVMRVNNSPLNQVTPYPYVSLFQTSATIFDGVRMAIDNTGITQPLLQPQLNGVPVVGVNYSRTWRPGKWVAAAFNFGTTSSSVSFNNEPFPSAVAGGFSSGLTENQFTINQTDVDYAEILIYTGALSAADDIEIKRYLMQKYHLTASEIAVWFGDSITKGQNSSDNETLSFPAIVSRDRGWLNLNFGVAFTTVDSLNALYPGVPGQNLKDQIQTVLTPKTIDPDHTTIFINYGSNDYPYTQSVGYSAWIAKYKPLINQIIGLGYHPDRIIVGGPPFQTSRSQDSILSTTVSTMCNELGVKFFSSVNYMKTYGGEIFITHPDSIHLNDAGHARFALGEEAVVNGSRTWTQNPAFWNNADVDPTTASFNQGDTTLLFFNTKTEKWNPIKNPFLYSTYQAGLSDTALVDLNMAQNVGIVDSIEAGGNNFIGTLNSVSFQNYGQFDKILPANTDGYVQTFRSSAGGGLFYLCIFWLTPVSTFENVSNDAKAGIYYTSGNVYALDGGSDMLGNLGNNSGQGTGGVNDNYYRVRRQGSTFYAEKSTDGITWTLWYTYGYHSTEAMYIGCSLDRQSFGHLYYPKCRGCAATNYPLLPRKPLSLPVSRTVPTAAGTTNLRNNTINILDPATAISGQTLKLPAFPSDGDIVSVVSAGAIGGTVTHTALSGTVVNAPPAYTPGSKTDFVYNFAQAKWFAGGSSASGSYTPTLTSNSNAASPTLDNAYYTRIGNIVTVTIGFQCTPASGSSTSQLQVTLPFTTATTTQTDVGPGAIAINAGAATYVGAIVSVNGATTAVVDWFTTTAASVKASVTFTYKVN